MPHGANVYFSQIIINSIKYSIIPYSDPEPISSQLFGSRRPGINF
jgi:hypothetical protein